MELLLEMKIIAFKQNPYQFIMNNIVSGKHMGTIYVLGVPRALLDIAVETPVNFHVRIGKGKDCAKPSRHDCTTLGLSK